jgi:hypothetical protein
LCVIAAPAGRDLSALPAQMIQREPAGPACRDPQSEFVSLALFLAEKIESARSS